MPNGIGTPKGILLSQAEVPKTALSATPLAALGLGITGILSTIASVIPDVPALPTTIIPKGAGIPQIPVVTEFIKSIESSLPAGIPKITGQGVTEEKVAPAPARAPTLVFE